MFNSDYKDRPAPLDSKHSMGQAEFFADLSGRSKKTRKTKLNLAKIVVSLSYENVIILSIGLIMLLIAGYCLGVEKGKHRAQFKSEPVKSKPASRPEAEKKMPEAEKKMEAGVAAKNYTIQVATFRNTASVKQELARLNKRGYQPFVVNRGEFSELCVGNYQNKDEAYRDLKKLKKTYADSYLRYR